MSSKLTGDAWEAVLSHCPSLQVAEIAAFTQVRALAEGSAAPGLWRDAVVRFRPRGPLHRRHRG